MKKVVLASMVGVLISVVMAYAAWMGNINHHCQVRVPDGWNTESEVIVKDGKQAHMVLAAPEKEPMVAAIFSMEVEKQIDLRDFKAIFESMILKNAKVIEEQKRGFNNLKGIFVIYEADFDGTAMKLMCFFTQKDKYLYGVFTGTTKDRFDDNKAKLDELIVTFQYLK